MYVPKKSSLPQPGINNNDGEYEGIWSGPISIPVSAIRKSHKTRPEQTIAQGYEDIPIRIQRIVSDSYNYQIVDGNKRLKRAKSRDHIWILAYIWEGKYNGSISAVGI
jgi:hypothetical protein